MVYRVETTSETVKVNNVDCEVKYCHLADNTESMKLALWESHIDLVQCDKSYNFTDLATRVYQGEKNMTTTRNTIITTLATPVPFKLPSSTAIENTTLLHLTAPIESAKIKVLKQCPKCLSPQPNLDTKQEFHRCNKCKFLRKSERYMTKCHGILTFQIKSKEVDLKIANSLLNGIIQEKAEISHMDEQDMEELLIKCGTFNITYTSDFFITSIQQPQTASPEQQEKQSNTSENAPTNEPCSSPELQSPSSRQKRKNDSDCPAPPKKNKDEEIPASPSTPTEDMALDDLAKLFDN